MQDFQLALDDFVLQEQYSEHSNLFQLIDFIKVDFLAYDDSRAIRN